MSEHEAGRDLDALIAESVMGWKPTAYIQYAPGWDEPLLDGVGHYSTDIAAAWEVLESMCGGGYWWRLERDGAKALVMVRFVSERGISTAAEADTAPLAICRAALEAVGA